MSMQAYLASKYMSGPKADAILSRSGTAKKKKRKLGDTGGGSKLIIDEDGGWGADTTSKDDVEDVEEAVVASDRSFKKRKADDDVGWKTVKEPTPPPAEDEKPIIVEETATPFEGGLITAKDLRKRMSRKTPEPVIEATEMEQETVYRDASGRRIDTKAERAEAARKKREREEKEAEKMEWGKGFVQREDEERKKAELALESTRDLARYADDTTLNERLKAEERWNDPAVAFLSKKRSKGPRRPEYKGPDPPPNRFGIRPGYRWDGVDRGNGFEKKIFQKTNERQRHNAASHDWSVEDM